MKPTGVFTLAANRVGQASIMIGMMLMTFLLFFVFVLNTGMLVNAKINLQNAADLAAYAGAATQARQLNQIAYLNYEMRRQYKKFLFRYYVMGGQAERTHPQTPSAGRRVWSAQVPGSAGAGSYNPDFEAPHVCITFAQNDNYCQIAENPAIKGLDLPVRGDAITAALLEQLRTMERVRAGNCRSIADLNVKTLSLWLFNSDPELTELVNPGVIPNEAARQGFERMRGIARGIGLVPRELILLQRIRTLASYVNALPEQAMNLEKAGQLNAAPDLVKNERALQAFFSAYYTLGNHTFSDGSLSMDELLPTNQDQAQLINLEEITTSFQAFASTYDSDERPQPGGGQACKLKLAPIFVERMPIGVAKDPSVLTYYAIRLKARAKVLFSPFGDVELKAYAAAQPFGSRIGPPLSLVQNGFTHNVRPDSTNIAGDPAYARQLYNSFTGVPNLPIEAGDPAQPVLGSGWDTNFMIGSLFQKYSPEGAVGPPQRIGPAELDRAYQAAMVPNPWETQYYNIPTDLGTDPFIRLFDSRGNMSFWAPVLAPNDVARGRDIMRAEVDRLFDVGRIPPSRLNPNVRESVALMKQVVLNGVTRYLDSLSQGAGENGEGMNIVRISDPFSTRADPATGAGGQIINLSPRIMVQTFTQAKTSWNAVNDASYRELGRLGYSVKFVSFDSLTRNKAPSTQTGDTWSNDLPLEDDAQLDVQFIKH